MRTLWWVLGLFLPWAVKAQGRFEPGAAKLAGLPQVPLEELILNIINAFLVLAAVLALAFMVYGGFRYIRSRGEEREVEDAKATITYAVIGLVVLGIAAAIINFVVDAVLGGGAGAPPGV